MRIDRLMAEASGGDDGKGGGAAAAAAGGGSGAADAGAGGAAPAGAGGGAGGAGGATLLEEIGKGAAPAGGSAAAGAGGEGQDNLTPEQRAMQAAEKDTRRPKGVPAKYWDAEKGEVRYEAWGQSTTSLEARMRDVGLPPKDASEYKFDVPEQLKAAGVDLDPAMSKAFREQAHALGLTQKQYEGVMGAYLQSMGDLANQSATLSRTKAEQELTAFYKTPEALNENVRLAFKAFSAYADENDMALIDQIGNIPAVIRVLAKVGRELHEDPGVSPDAILAEESLQELMRGGPGKEDSPYWNPGDPRHKTVVSKVTRHHEAQSASRQRRQAA